MCDKLREEKPCIDRYADEEQQDRPKFGISRKGKKLCRYLHQQPRHDCVGDGNFVNVAPLQFAEEILRIHGDVLFFGAKTFATSASKRGSPRSGSRKGSTLIRAMSAPARS